MLAQKVANSFVSFITFEFIMAANISGKELRVPQVRVAV